MRLKYQISISILLIGLSNLVVSQNLDKMGKRDMLKVTGGLNYSSVFYNAGGIENRRQPFTWFLNGNITATILDISLPFTFNYTNNQIRYTQPYNIQSFNPTYKWVKGYFGITSMNFSQYTMAGHIFTGGGVELTPKNFKFATLYGQFKKSTSFDIETNSDANMAYRRMGFGAYAGYEKNGYALKLIYFSAKDQPSSLTAIPPNSTLTPMENTVISITGKAKLLKHLSTEAEYALSGLTRNITSPPDLTPIPTNRLPYIFTPNATSQFFSAFKSSLNFNYNILAVGLNYERVAPEYRSLGAYYFNNDLENITISPALNLMKGKMNLALNTGIQRNNLDGRKLNTSKRWIGSSTISYVPSQKWNFMGMYSNFSTFTKQRPQTDPFFRNTLDTLNFYQLSQSGMLSASHSFGKEKLKQNLNLSLNYMVTAQDQGGITDPGFSASYKGLQLPSKVLNANISHSMMFKEQKLSFSSAANSNLSQFMGNNILFIGPSINISKSFKNSLRVGGGITYNKVLTNGIATNDVFNHRINFSYAPQLKNKNVGKLSFNGNLNYMQKLKANSIGLAFLDFYELTANIGANYNF